MTEHPRRFKKSDFFPKQVRPAAGGRPRIEQQGMTLEAMRPWEALGMSRDTWYRRRREYIEKAGKKNG